MTKEEPTYVLSDYASKPYPIKINLDKYPYGQGFEEIIITCNEEEFKFSKCQIHSFLKGLEKMRKR